MKDRWKILFAVVGFLVLMICVWLVMIRVQPENKVEAYKKSLREKGEKLEISEVIPPPIPAASNSVMAVQAAFRMLGPDGVNIPNAMKMVAPGRALVGWRQPDARGDEFTNSWDDFTSDMAANRPILDLLQQVLERPQLDFQLNYKKGFWMLLPHLTPLRHSEQLLATATVCDLHQGDTGAVTTNILTLLGLVQRNETEGVLISHLVRIAMTSIAVVPTWELLQATNVSDAQLAAVQAGWEQMDFFSGAINAFVMERAYGIDMIQKARASPGEFAPMLGSVSSLSSGGSSSSGWTWPPDWEAITERPRYAVGEAMWRSSWSYTDELRTLQSDTIILETLRTMQTNQNKFYKADYDAMQLRLSSLGITNAGEAFFRALKIPNLSEIFGDYNMSSAIRKTIQIETARRVVVTAIALKRFQLKHDKLPETLNELMPEFLQAIPIDPNDGNPLRYHPNTDGTFLLYSIGDDGVDNGGDSTISAGSSAGFYWQGNKVRDWVWPQPATAAEIEAYYEEQTRKSHN